MKIKVGVFFGGNTTEHEVSIISALQAIAHFDTDKYEAIPIYISKQSEFYYGDVLANIENYKNIPELLKKCVSVSVAKVGNKFFITRATKKIFQSNVIEEINIAFPIVHGTNVEDGSLQGYFKTLNIPFVGCSVLSSAIGMDKYFTKVILKNANIPVVDCITLLSNDLENEESIVKKVESSFKYPVIVKPINLGSSIGISKATNRDTLLDAINNAFIFSKKIIIERAIENLKEINVAVLGDSDDITVSECEEPITQNDILNFQDKYIDNSKGSKQSGMASLKRKIPADISTDLKDKIQTLARNTFIELDCSGVIRIDFLIDTKTNEIYVNELNTIPGSLAFYLFEASGIKYKELIDRLIHQALKRERIESEIIYSFETNILSIDRKFSSKGSKTSS